MYYIKFDGWNGNATIYEFEKKVEIIHGTPVPMNRLISSETGLASDLQQKRGIVPVTDVIVVDDLSNVEYNIQGSCPRYGEGFDGAINISKYKLKDMVPAKKTDEKFTVEHERGVYRFNPPIEHFMKG